MKTQQVKNIWDAAKAVLRGKFIAIQSYLKKQEKHLIDNLTLNNWKKENEKTQNQQKEKNHKDPSRNK